MAANAGIIKVNVTFYRIINSDTQFERHGSRIPIRDDLNTAQALKEHLVSSVASRNCRLNTASENLKSKYIIHIGSCILWGASIVISVDISVDASVDMSVATRSSIDRVSVDIRPRYRPTVGPEYRLSIGRVSVYTSADMCVDRYGCYLVDARPIPYRHFTDSLPIPYRHLVDTRSVYDLKSI